MRAGNQIITGQIGHVQLGRGGQNCRTRAWQGCIAVTCGLENCQRRRAIRPAAGTHGGARWCCGWEIASRGGEGA